MPSFQRLSFSLMEVQMNWPTFLLGSQGEPGVGGDQPRSSVFGKLSGVAANQSGGVAPTFLIVASTSALVFGFGGGTLACWPEATPSPTKRNRSAAACFMRASGIRSSRPFGRP